MHTADIPLLVDNPHLEPKPLHIPVLMLRVPRPLHAWMAKLNWGEVLHAILCEAHRAVLDGLSLHVLAPSLRRELRSMTKRERYWEEEGLDDLEEEGEFGYSSGSEEDGDPFDTADSRELRQLESQFGKGMFGAIPIGRAWSSVPVAVSIRLAGTIKGQSPIDALIHASWGLWVMFVDIATRQDSAKVSEYAERFSHLITTKEFELLWAQIDAICEMGGVRRRCRCPIGVDRHGKIVVDNEHSDGRCRWEENSMAGLLDKETAVKLGRQRFSSTRTRGVTKSRKREERVKLEKRSKKRETYFAYLPEEILTEHIIPKLCFDGNRTRRRRGEEGL